MHLPWKLILLGGAGVLGLVLLLLLLATVLHRKQNRSDWASPGLYGVEGRMGAGKSYMLAWCGVQALASGRPVWANFDLQGAHRYTCWADLLEVPQGDPDRRETWPMVLMDEVHLWWPREAWRAPGDVMAWASQLRKQKITMFWASQSVAFVSNRLIRLTFGIWSCVRLRSGHQYTLWAAETYQRLSQRERLSRMYVKRAAAVMAAYNTNEIVAGSMEWGDGQGFESLSVRRSAPGADRPSEAVGRTGAGPRHLAAVVDPEHVSAS